MNIEETIKERIDDLTEMEIRYRRRLQKAIDKQDERAIKIHEIDLNRVAYAKCQLLVCILCAKDTPEWENAATVFDEIIREDEEDDD